jgi:uncharacterized RDD family membrane protein YckC
MRFRVLAGTLILVFGLAAYALAVMSLAVRVLPDSLILETLFYAIAGIAWVLPAAKLTRWMQQTPGR